MVYYNKNKNELLVLTGAVYSFVAYLTAFTLEILFIIDLAKRSSNLMAETINSPSSTTVSQSTAELTANSNGQHHDQHQAISSQQQNLFTQTTTTTNTFDQARLALESMQTHVTVSCLAISILYFIIFVASLILIISIILRSTFFLLIWMCTMATMYLPEFALIIYVSFYGWGIETRNGQTELLFYLIRAILNATFIHRAYRLYKDWQYEKNFFMLKSSSLGSSSNHSRFNSAGYDSPYFIGDSLTTTINPVFSSSTLNLDRYDAIRDFNNSPIDNNNNFQDYNPNSLSFQNRNRKVASMYNNTSNQFSLNDHHHNRIGFGSSTAFYGNLEGPKSPDKQNNNNQLNNINRNNNNNNKIQSTPHRTSLYQIRPSSVLSINDNDDFADYEMDLDYRTLTHQRHYHKQQNENRHQHQPIQGRRRQQESNTTAGQLNNRSPNGISYSTQSLDRRHLHDMDFALPEQVILRPLGHQPFDYLNRPGSTSNLNMINNINTQPQAHLASTNTTIRQTAKRYNYNLHDRFS